MKQDVYTFEWLDNKITWRGRAVLQTDALSFAKALMHQTMTTMGMTVLRNGKPFADLFWYGGSLGVVLEGAA